MDISLISELASNIEVKAQIITGLVAIISAVAILVVTHWLRNCGKIIVSVCKIEGDFKKTDNEGGQEPVNSVSEAEWVCINFEIDFWNSSDVPKSIRDLRIELVNERNSIDFPLIVYANNSGNEWVHPVYSHSSQDLSVLNLTSKQITSLKFHIIIPPESHAFLNGKIDFYLTGKYPKGKQFRSKLATRNY